MKKDDKDLIFISVSITAIIFIILSLGLVIDLIQANDEIQKLEMTLKQQLYEKQTQRIQLEQIKTCVTIETMLQQNNPNLWISSECYRYLEP